jgi:hypothetical protein
MSWDETAAKSRKTSEFANREWRGFRLNVLRAFHWKQWPNLEECRP